MKSTALSLTAVIMFTAVWLAGCDNNSSNARAIVGPVEPEPPQPAVDLLSTSFTFEGEPCTTPEGAEQRTLYITPDCVDPELPEAYIDIDEERTATDAGTGKTVTYRYVHGGFTETNARFAFYYPSPQQYKGRFFQTTYPTVGTEGARDESIVFAISHGAYVVSSNNGGGVTRSPATGGYRVNVAAARVSRMVAQLIYGEEVPTRGYIYGVSGGSLQTIGAVQRSEGVYAGSVPIVPAVPNAIPSFQSVQVLGLRVLQDKLADVADALEPGGSGDPYATLEDAEREILQEVTKLGFPLRGWWQWQRLTGGAFQLTVLAVEGIDASYVDDFYNLPGYEGFDDPDVQALRVQFDTTIAAVGEASITLSDTPTGYLAFADLLIETGAAAGEKISNVSVQGDEVAFPEDAGADTVAALAVGDQVRVDNSLWIALQYYQRHQVPSPQQYGWNQYRSEDGEPLYVQRNSLVGEIISNVFGGIPSGRFNGKMIMLGSVMDVEAFTWSVDWFRQRALENSGSQLDENYRLWLSDNADHVGPRYTEANAHIVSYQGAVEQALLYLDDWVTNGTRPPASSGYEVTGDNQVQLADNPAERGGVQPLVTLKVTASDDCDSGSDDVRVDVAAGEPVSFSVSAVAPAGTGNIIGIEWDFDSTGEFPLTSELDESSPEVDLCRTHVYDTPGTHFAVVRVTSQREGNPDADYERVQNLARARVVVE